MSTPIFTLTINADTDVENPSEWGGWKVVSFNRRHASHEDPSDYLRRTEDGSVVGANIGLIRKLQVGTAFLLDYYEHSLCRWSTSGSGPQCQWDTSHCAGIILWTEKPKDLNARTYADRETHAQAFLDTYSDWCNGFCHYFMLEDAEGDIVDSASAMIGTEDAEGCIKEALDGLDAPARIIVEGDGAWLVDGIALPDGVTIYDEDDEDEDDEEDAA